MGQAASTAQPGLWLSPSPLGAPDGALAVADNCVIRYAGILESRRGFGVHSTHSGLFALGAFGATVVGATTSQTQYFSGGTWHSMGTTSLPTLGPYPQNQFFTVNNIFYATSGTGLQRTDLVTDPLQLAGLIRAAPFTATSVTFVDSNLGIPNSAAVAYTTLYQHQIGSITSIVSPPSAPFTAANKNGAAACAVVTVHLGPQLVAGDIVQLYRTVTAVSGIPSQEFFLLQSFPVTSAMLATGSFTFRDSVPDANLGTALYTNESEEGAAQENDPPPLSGDVCQFMGYTIYANIARYYSMSLTLVAAGVNVSDTSTQLSNGLQIGDILTFVTSAGTVSLTAGTDFAATTANWDVPGYVVQSLADTINANATLKQVFQASAYQLEDLVLLEAISPTTQQWTLQFTSTVYPITTGNIVQQTSPATTAEVIQTGPQPIEGQIVAILPVSTPDSNFPAGDYIINTVSGTDFFYTNPKSPPPSPGTASTQPYTWQNAYPWLAWNIVAKLTTTPGLYKADNGVDVAGLVFSKFQQPEADPLENSMTVGNPTYPIARVIPLRQSVLIFKQGDGIWQLTGSDPSTFVAVPYDLTTQIAQPWSAAALNDNVCFVSTKGPVGVNESGGVFPLGPAGCPIREQILEVSALSNANTMFGLGYESEKDYILWTPITSSGMYAYAQEAWVFNLNTNAWTRWPLNAVCGFVDTLNTNTIFYTDGTTVFQERKSYTSADYTDGASATISISSVSGNVLSTASTVAVGDKVTQGGVSGWIISTVPGTSATMIGTTGGAFTAGSATRQPAIPCAMLRVPQAGTDGNPGVSHRFQEVAYNFRLFQAPWLQFDQTTSLNPNNGDYPYNQFPSTSGYGVILRAGVAPDNVQAVLLQAGFTHAAALCNFQLQATSLVDAEVSTRLAGG